MRITIRYEDLEYSVMVPPRPPVPERKLGPTRYEAVLAWRAWSLEWHDDQWKLGSVGMSWVWQPGENEASHVRSGCWMPSILPVQHEVPDWSCTCGFWGCPTLQEAQSSIKGSGLSVPAHIYGTALLWGRIVQHEYGYRASRAQAVGLLKPQSGVDKHVEAAHVVAEKYGVPLVAEPWMLGG